MTLDETVKIAQIATPFILLGIGFLLNRSIQNHSQSIKITSEFNTKWSDDFILKCRSFSQNVSELQDCIFEMSNKSRNNTDLLKKFNSLVPNIRKEYYNIEVHSSLIDDTTEIISTVKLLFSLTAKNVESVRTRGHVDFEAVKLLQTKLHRQLKDKQKAVLKL